MVVNIEPAIAATAPAPVEVHHIVVVVSVEHVCVTAATVYHRPAHVDSIDNQLHIALMGVILAIKVLHPVGVEEIGGHPFAKTTRDGATARGTIVHVDRNAHVIDELGHRLDLHLGRVSRDRVGHVFPVVGRLTEIDRQRAIFRMVLGRVSVAPLSVQRMVPVFHQLGGGSGHTACIAMASRAAFAFRAEVVVRIVLVPCGLHEVLVFPAAVTRHEPSRPFEHSPVGGHRRLGRSSLRRRHHALSYHFQVVGQSGSHVVGVEDALFRIADDGSIVVVTCDNDKTHLTYIEDVIAGLSPVGKSGIDQRQVAALAYRIKIGSHKGPTKALCSLTANGTGLKCHAKDHQSQQEYNVLFHSAVFI